MFPPKPTDNLQQWVMGVGESLARAGDHVSGSANAVEVPKGIQVTLYLREAVPAHMRKYVVGYVKAYGKESGWNSKDFKWSDTELKFVTKVAPPKHGPVSLENQGRTCGGQSGDRSLELRTTKNAVPQCTLLADEARRPESGS